MSDLVLSERRGATALLTLNRADALNALNAELLTALGQAVAEIASDRDVRAVVITGAGRAFAAGADIAQMRSLTPLEAREFSRLGHDVFGALEALAVPTVAAVNGFALGGGCELAISCDWIYASAKAKFGQPEVNLGLVPGFGGTSRLARKVGPGWARELALTGEMIDIEIAERIGLVNRRFEDPEALLAGALQVCETIAAKGPLAVAAGKRLLVEGPDADARVAHSFEQEAFGAIFATADHEEGMDAFLEKRPPIFKAE